MDEYMKKQFDKIVAVSQYINSKLNCMAKEYSVNGFDLDNFNSDVDSIKSFSNKILSVIIKDNNDLMIALEKKTDKELESVAESKPETKVVEEAKPVVVDSKEQDDKGTKFEDMDFDVDDDDDDEL